MSLESFNQAGQTNKAVTELQGLSIELLVGAAADAKIDVAAIRSNDTLVKALERDGTTHVLADITANLTISDLRASGTLTLDTVIADETATVDGVVYTFSDTAGDAYTSVQVGADDTESAVNLAEAINGVETSAGQPNEFFAESALAVVTITARSEGIAGNNITTVGDTTITAAAATLEGGTATGGIECSSDTTGDQIVLFWFNKG